MNICARELSSFAQRRSRLAVAVLLVLPILLAGCNVQTPIKYGLVFPRHGRAYVYSVDPWMRDARVRIAQGRRIAWWDADSLLFYNGQRTRTLEAKPGQTIHFNGLDADGELFLSRAWVGAEPTSYNFSPHLPMISQNVTLKPAPTTRPVPATQSHVLPQLPK